MKYLLLVFLFIGCGTETGNPIQGGGLFQGGQVSLFTYRLAESVCEKLIECYDEVISVNDCIKEVEDIDGFDIALNLDSNYTDLNDIYIDESGSVITSSSTEAAQCITDINALSCSDSEVINAFNSSSPNDYSNTANIVPTNAGSCQDALSVN